MILHILFCNTTNSDNFFMCRISVFVQLQMKVDEFMDGNIQIMSLCVQISEQLLIKIEKNKLYEHLSFENEQVKFSSTK